MKKTNNNERQLPCKLTLDEKRLRGEALARLRAEWADAEAARKAANAASKALQERIDGDADKLADAIRTGREMRDVEIAEIRNGVSMTMDTVRQDTGEVIDSRPLTVEERQIPMLFPVSDEDTDKDRA